MHPYRGQRNIKDEIVTSKRNTEEAQSPVLEAEGHNPVPVCTRFAWFCSRFKLCNEKHTPGALVSAPGARSTRRTRDQVRLSCDRQDLSVYRKRAAAAPSNRVQVTLIQTRSSDGASWLSSSVKT